MATSLWAMTAIACGLPRSGFLIAVKAERPKWLGRNVEARSAAGEPGRQIARSCRHAREPETNDDAAALGNPRDVHGRQLVTRLGMAASPRLPQPVTPLAPRPLPGRPVARRLARHR